MTTVDSHGDRPVGLPQAGLGDAMSEPADARVDLPIRSSRLIHHGHVFDFRADEVELGAGTVVLREYLDHPGAVGIIALNDRGEILLQNQYRHPVRSVLWEPPAGLLDVPGEEQLAAAQRELFEEADLRAADWRRLFDFFTSPGGSSELIRVFVARQLSEVPAGERFARFDEEATMRAAWLGLDAAAELVFAGKLRSPTAVLGILAALRVRDTIGFDALDPA